MKKLLIAALLGITIVLQSAGDASAYCKFSFGCGISCCWESSNCCVLWGALSGGPPCFPVPVGPEFGYGEAYPVAPAAPVAAPQAAYANPYSPYAAPAPQAGYGYPAQQGGYAPAPAANPGLPVLPTPNQAAPRAGQQNAQPVAYYQKERQAYSAGQQPAAYNYNAPAYNYAPAYYAPSYWYNNR